MNKKRNVSYIKPEDPEFLKILKKQVGYDNTNHKFDKLESNEEDFEDDKESELPQVVVIKEGDLTAEEAEAEKKRIEEIESVTKADLNQRVLFKSKRKVTTEPDVNKRKHKNDSGEKTKGKKSRHLLSFDDEEGDE